MKSLNCVRLFVTPWTVAHQAPLSMGFSRQEYWSGLPCPPLGNLPDPGIEPTSPALQADSLFTELLASFHYQWWKQQQALLFLFLLLTEDWKWKWSRSVVPDSLPPHGQWPAPSSSVHGIFQARVLEWVAISFSRESPRPRDQTQVSRIVDRRFTFWATGKSLVDLYNTMWVPGAQHSDSIFLCIVKSSPW